MRFTLFVLLVVFGAVFADGLTSDISEVTGGYSGCLGTDDTIDSYALDAGSLHTSGFANFHATGQADPYITADDFQISPVDAQIDVITYWTTGADNPATADVFLYEDASPGPGAQLQAVTATVAASATTVPWGSDFVYQVVLTLDTPLSFDLGAVYWLAPMRPGEGTTWYTCVGTVVRGTDCYLQYQGVWGPWTAQGQPAADMFRIMEGSTSSLERTTWGSIKNLF
ncbi:MAG: hypothetical protein U9P42_02975 [Candidatus Fermentibacteria bacterium]|nr:hypothetical protein [Candidatus Fermentibacteria bacterium]